jgi:hypothetical protein
LRMGCRKAPVFENLTVRHDSTSLTDGLRFHARDARHRVALLPSAEPFETFAHNRQSFFGLRDFKLQLLKAVWAVRRWRRNETVVRQ